MGNLGASEGTCDSVTLGGLGGLGKLRGSGETLEVWGDLRDSGGDLGKSGRNSGSLGGTRGVWRYLWVSKGLWGSGGSLPY